MGVGTAPLLRAFATLKSPGSFKMPVVNLTYDDAFASARLCAPLLSRSDFSRCTVEQAGYVVDEITDMASELGRYPIFEQVLPYIINTKLLSNVTGDWR